MPGARKPAVLSPTPHWMTTSNDRSRRPKRTQNSTSCCTGKLLSFQNYLNLFNFLTFLMQRSPEGSLERETKPTSLWQYGSLILGPLNSIVSPSLTHEVYFIFWRHLITEAGIYNMICSLTNIVQNLLYKVCHISQSQYHEFCLFPYSNFRLITTSLFAKPAWHRKLSGELDMGPKCVCIYGAISWVSASGRIYSKLLTGLCDSKSTRS